MEHGDQCADSSSAHDSKFISVLRSEYLRLRCERNYWEAQCKGTLESVERYKVEIEELKAQVHKLNARIFSQSKGEAGRSHQTSDKPKAKRGKKPGAKGFGRKSDT